MTLPWYPKNIGKYAKKTKKLSLLQHGAYNLLLDEYYENGPILSSEQCSSNAQLMPDHSGIYKLCVAYTKAEMDAVDYVLNTYFWLDKDGYYRNNECDEVIEKQTKTHEKRVETGRKNRAKALLKQYSSNAPQKEKEIYKENNKRKILPVPEIPSGDEFDQFWEAWPKKTGVGAARSAFTNEVMFKAADPSQIVRAARALAYKVKDMPIEEQKFIPKASNWLVDQSYLDPDLQIEPPKPINMDDFEEWQRVLAGMYGIHIVKSWFGEATLEGGILNVKNNFIANKVKSEYSQGLNRIGVKDVKVG